MLLAVSLVAAWEVAMDLDPSGLEPRPIRMTADAPSNRGGTRVCAYGGVYITTALLESTAFDLSSPTISERRCVWPGWPLSCSRRAD